MKTDIESTRRERRHEWREYPLGTKAHSITGGAWTRVERGWKWGSLDGIGGVFPTPGGDAIGKCIELPPMDHGADLTGHHVEYWGGEWIVQEKSYIGSWGGDTGVSARRRNMGKARIDRRLHSPGAPTRTLRA